MAEDRYIARLKHPFAEVEPITKEVTELINADKNTNIKGLIKYLIKDDGFNEDEKNIANTVSEMMTRCSEFLETPQNEGVEILAIKAIDDNGQGRTFTSGYLNREGIPRGEMLDPLAKATNGTPPFFEDKSIDSEKYKGLDLVVTTQGKGGYF